MRATRAMMRMKPRAASGPWKRGWIRSFIGSTGKGLEGALNFHLQFSTDAAAVGVGDAIPYVGTGRVAVKPFRVGYAGFDRGRNCAVTGNAGSVEVV